MGKREVDIAAWIHKHCQKLFGVGSVWCSFWVVLQKVAYKFQYIEVWNGF